MICNLFHNKELILLTIECFKKLCMLSKTKNSEKVRDYYLELEKLVDKYKDTIIETMKKELSKKDREIQVLKNDLKAEEYPDGDHVYVFREIDEFGDIYYRIGLAEKLKKRFAVHNSSSVHKKELIFKIKTDDMKYLEKCLLTLLSKYRYKKRKDHFKTSIEKVEKAIGICNDCIIEFRCYDCEKGNEVNEDYKNESFGNHLLNYHLHPNIKFNFKLDQTIIQ